MRASEEIAFEKRRADAARLRAAAKALRSSAVHAGYAGLRGTYVGIAIASLLDNVASGLGTVPEQLRRDALAIANFQLDGPDGANDPRSAGRKGLAAGPGH